MLMNWTPQQWEELKRRHPEAAAFLIRTSLENEREYLAKAQARNAWQNDRLKTLQALTASRCQN